MKNNTGKYFYSSIVGFCLGISLTDVFDISKSFLVFCAVLSISVSAFLILRKKVRRVPTNTHILLIVLITLFFVMGGLRFESLKTGDSALPLNSYEGQNAELVAKVSDELSGNRLLLDVFAVVSNGVPEVINKERIIYNNAVGVFGYGDMLVVKGNLDKPKNFESDDGRNFDYVSYLKRQGIYHVMSFGSIIEKRENDQITLKSILFKIKNWFTSNVESLVPEPESSLANGVTVAGKGSLPKDVQTDFVKAGLIHIVVLSGYNIAIVIRAMMWVFGLWGRKIGVVFAGVGIILFVIMTGGTPPVVRSAIMASITLLGTLSYKNVLPNRALFGALFVMVFWNPYSLLYDASFALSILATFAIINCSTLMKELMWFVTDRFQTKQILAETISTQIIVLPYLLYEIGNLSIVAPVSNIIVLPFIPWIMLLTFVVGMIAFVPVISLPFAWTLIVVSSFVIYVTHILANIPFGYFQINHFPLWVMMLCYVGLYMLWIWYKNKKGVVMEKVVDSGVPY